MEGVAVSVVIVCMNKLQNLCPCLDSIRKYTTVNFETLVVAYLFSPENLKKVRADYPWVKFIESNEIRGFSENNNLALRQAKGKYCLVLNDDTEFKSDVIVSLIRRKEGLPDNVATLSPKLLYKDGSNQYCGYGEIDFKSVIKREFCFPREEIKPSIYVNQQGCFETQNITGAAFLIKTDLFRAVGFFDERYFFCPEDIALSSKLRKEGYGCYVDADTSLFHYEGGTWGVMRTATMPTQLKGEQLFVSNGSALRWYLFALLIFPVRLIKSICWALKYLVGRNEKDKVMAVSNSNVCLSIFSRKPPKEVFIRFYNKLK